MSGYFNESRSRPADPSHYGPGRCINCEEHIHEDDDYAEDGLDVWCDSCWSRRPKDEEEPQDE